MKTETSVGIFVIAAIGILFYLSINIGSFRMDRDLYAPYKTYFDDTGGLDIKAPIKIAGVDVGWVDSIVLLEGGKAEVNLMINKKNRLSQNAYALIQQEGLIGAKTLEIDPGDPSAGYLSPGSTLTMPGKSPAGLGDLLDQFRNIATSIHDIATSFRNVFASQQGEDAMKKSLRNISNASEKIAAFSDTINEGLQKNIENINVIVQDLRSTMGHLHKGIPRATQDFHVLTSSLVDDVFPQVNKNIEKLTLAFADDTLPKIGSMSKTVESSFEEIKKAAHDAQGGLQKLDGVMGKVDAGKGFVGKLINEDETYYDMRKTLKGFKHFVHKTQSLGIYIDMHSENLLKTNLSKGYFEIKLRPSHDYFYQLQLVADENGSITRDVFFTTYKDAHGSPLLVDQLVTNGRDQMRFAEQVESTVQRKNDILFGLQFGKKLNRLTFRIGLFESTFGAALDYYVPLQTDKVHWITTFEAFDFTGTKRRDDSRPHLKWMNKAYFFKNMYTSFGIDDIYSKRSATPFFGGGLRFGDDDLKYFLSLLPFGSLKG